MDEMLRVDLDAPRKQRHTAHRIWERLVDEHDATIAYRTVSRYVAARRPEIVLEARNRAGVADGFVPQTHLPGQDAEVWVNVGGVDTKCFLFTLRMSFSGRAIHRVYSSQGQEAFFAGHVAAFTELGGVPAGEIRYDNLSSAVRRVCFGRSRIETDRWVLFKSAYGVTSFYCMPGKEGAHEKGGVEGEGGRFRRRRFVPVPKIADISGLAGINDKFAAADRTEDARHIDQRTNTIGGDFSLEAPLLAALPVDEFDIALTTTPRVDRYARITVRQALYSVPARLIGQTVRAKLDAENLVVLHGSTEVARHPRLTTKGGQPGQLKQPPSERRVAPVHLDRPARRDTERSHVDLDPAGSSTPSPNRQQPWRVLPRYRSGGVRSACAIAGTPASHWAAARPERSRTTATPVAASSASRPGSSRSCRRWEVTAHDSSEFLPNSADQRSTLPLNNSVRRTMRVTVRTTIRLSTTGNRKSSHTIRSACGHSVALVRSM
jgi:hypothetical protein